MGIFGHLVLIVNKAVKLAGKRRKSKSMQVGLGYADLNIPAPPGINIIILGSLRGRCLHAGI